MRNLLMAAAALGLAACVPQTHEKADVFCIDGRVFRDVMVWISDHVMTIQDGPYITKTDTSRCAVRPKAVVS